MKVELYGENGEFQEYIEINRYMSRFNGLDYMVYNRDVKREGFVEIRFRNLSWFEDRNEPVVEPLIEIVRYNKETIAEIQQFRPHGYHPSSKLLRKGIGTIVLQSIIYDIVSNRIHFIYCRNPNDDPNSNFRKLLLKNGFEELKADDYDSHLLKIT